MDKTRTDAIPPRRMATSRLAGGGLAMVAVLLVADLLLPDFGPSAAWSVAQSMLVFFLGALAGAWLARSRFVMPALIVWALFWVVVSWLLYRIGEPVGGQSMAAILQYNWLAIALSGLAAVAGALSGGVLARAPATA